MSDGLKRFLRTLFQGSTASAVTAALVAFGAITAAQAAVVGPLLLLLCSAAQNALEDAGVVPKLLK